MAKAKDETVSVETEEEVLVDVTDTVPGTGVSVGVSTPMDPNFTPVETFSDWVDPATLEDTVVTSDQEARSYLND